MGSDCLDHHRWSCDDILSTTDLHKEISSKEIETEIFETLSLFLEFPDTENADVYLKISRVTLSQQRM